MAHLIAIVSPNPGPLPGQEQKALVYMSFEPGAQGDSALPIHAPRGPGYRISVHAAETGRELGRWVSDCALTATQSALLWLSMNPWQVEPAQGSLDYMRVMQEVAGHAAIPEGASPRDLIIALSLNLPGTPEVAPPPPGVSGPTGVRLLGGPVASPVQSHAPQFSEPHRGLPDASLQPLGSPGRGRGMVAVNEAPAALPAPRPAPAPQNSHGLEGDELEVGRFLARALRAIKRGAPAEVVMEAMAGLVGTEIEDDEDLYEEEDGVEIHDPTDSDYDDEYYDEEEDELPEAPGVSLEPQPAGLRPLLPGEYPPGATPELIAQIESMGGDDAGLRAKVERTRQRSSDVVMHARRVAAANEQARLRHAAAEAARADEIFALADSEEEPASSPQPANGTNGGGKPRMTKARLIEAISKHDPGVDPKALMKLKRAELVARLQLFPNSSVGEEPSRGV